MIEQGPHALNRHIFVGIADSETCCSVPHLAGRQAVLAGHFRCLVEPIMTEHAAPQPATKDDREARQAGPMPSTCAFGSARDDAETGMDVTAPLQDVTIVRDIQTVSI